MAKGQLTVRVLGDSKPFEKTVSNLGGIVKKGLLGVGVAGGAALAFGVFEGVKRGQIGDKLAAQLGLSPQESAKAGEIAGDLYADAYGESFEQVNDAVGTVASSLAELGSGDVEGLTAEALDLASAFDLEVSQAVTTAGTLLRNDLVDDAEGAMDLIAAGLQSVPAQMRDEVFPVLEEYGGFFNDLGLSGEDAMGMIVEASKGGVIEIDKVGDALKELTIRGTDMSTASVEAFEAAGLSAEGMAEALLAGGDDAEDAFGRIIDGLLSIEDPVEQSNAAIALFGTPLEDLGTARIPDFLETLGGLEGGFGDVEGAANDLGETLNDNAATRFEAAKRKLVDIAATIGETLVPAFDAFVGWLDEHLPSIQNWFDRVSEKFTDLLGVSEETTTEGIVLAENWGESWALASGLTQGVIDEMKRETGTSFAGMSTQAQLAMRDMESETGLAVRGARDAVGEATGDMGEDFDEAGTFMERMKDAWLVVWREDIKPWFMDTAVPWVENTLGPALGDAFWAAGRAAGGKLWSGVKSAFWQGVRNAPIIRDFIRAGDNIAGAWNNITGGGGSTLPGPGDRFDDGGVVGGRRGEPRMILAHGGETILPTHKGSTFARAGSSRQLQPIVLHVDLDGREIARSEAFWDQARQRLVRESRLTAGAA